MEDYTDEETQGINKSSSSSVNPPNTLGNKVKEKGKDAVKNGINSFKEALSDLWRKLPINIKAIVIGVIVLVILVALLIFVIMDIATNSATTQIGKYMETRENSEAGKMYKSTGSLLFVSDQDIQKMEKEFLEDIEFKSNVDYEQFKSKIEDLEESNCGIKFEEGAITIGQDVSIFTHILNAERYNFNRIIWREYDRDSTESKEVKLKVDMATRLQYPEDEKKNLEYFANLARPYLQSWLVPFTMMSGITTSEEAGEKAAEFAYEIMRSAFHKIEIEKRNLESINIYSQYREYDVYTYKTVVVRNCFEVPGPTTIGPDGETMVTTITSCTDTPQPPVLVGGPTHIVEDEVETGRETYTTSVYNYKRVATFDKLLNVNINVTTYNLNDEPDKRDIEETEYVVPDNVNTNVPQDKVPGVYESAPYTVIRNGKQYNITSNWNDKISTSYQEFDYTINDIEANATTELDTGDRAYYTKLDNDKKINLIDIMNASSSSYDRYVYPEEYSENIGFTRDKLQVSYSLLERYLADQISKNKFSFAYGSSLGVAVKYFGGLADLSLEVLQNIDTNATYVAPIQDSARIVDDVQIATNTYGYAGHNGIDIQYPYSMAEKSRCNDFSVSECPYISGPAVYTVQDGEIWAVAFSTRNTYYGTGVNNHWVRGNAPSQNDNGSYVVIKHTDANGNVNYSIYMHLFPDENLLNSLANRIGEKVNAGTYIGHMGNTGNSSGLHLHFEYARTLWRSGNGGTSLAILRLAGM